MACCEHNNLKIFCQIFQYFSGIRPNIDTSLNYLSSWKLDWKFNIVTHIYILIAVNQSFIKIENDSFNLCIMIYEVHPCFLLRELKRDANYSVLGSRALPSILSKCIEFIKCSRASEFSSL
jgi:hypothetical protein